MLSLNNKKLIFDKEDTKKRFIKIRRSSLDSKRGYDKNGKNLVPGNFCKILNGEFKEKEGIVIFCSNNLFFLKIRVQTDQFCVVSKEGENLIYIPNNEHNLKNLDEKNALYTVITKGQFKGYKCKVLKMEEHFLEVLVLSTSKMIKISKGDVKYL